MKLFCGMISCRVVPVEVIALCLLSATLLNSNSCLAQPDFNSSLSQLNLRTRQSVDPTIATVIRQISVRILNQENSGSGVLIDHQGQIYTVLTNAHVVAGNHNNLYTALTSDGETYIGHLLSSWQPTNDLALIQFSSNRTYSVAPLASAETLQMGQAVYAAGFPNWHLLSETQLEDTRDVGFQAFQLTVGQIEKVLPKPLAQGYQLGYTNEVVAGMSGGAILNCQGQLIGINGVLKHPPQGIAAYAFADGTAPSEALFQQIESLSWAIPISTIRQILTTP